jgi:glycosyltransferase involved in cell wall biosynthesis
MHTIDIAKPLLAERTSRIRRSAVPTVCLHSAGQKTMPDLLFMEHGVPPMRGGLSVPTDLSADCWIGTFGMLSEHKDIWSVIEACRSTGCGLRGVLATKDQEIRVKIIDLMNEYRIPMDVSFDFESEDVVINKLASSDIIYIPQRGVNYFATTGSVRFAMVVGKPIVVSKVPQFEDMRDAVIIADGTEAMENILRLKDDPAYYALWSDRVTHFRDQNGMGVVYQRLFSALEERVRQI